MQCWRTIRPLDITIPQGHSTTALVNKAEYSWLLQAALKTGCRHTVRYKRFTPIPKLKQSFGNKHGEPYNGSALAWG
jgi:hypothetical protein